MILIKDIKSFKTSFFTIITINLANKSFSAFFCKQAVINNIIMDNLASVYEKKVIYNMQSKYPEKLSAYECGFEAFGDSRMKFDVRFYLVAILFIIFDLEIAFLFPWAISLGNIGSLGFWSMMVFLLILTIGFIYEWKKGALDWD